jgi:hypothetical protein
MYEASNASFNKHYASAGSKFKMLSIGSLFFFDVFEHSKHYL